MRSKQKWTHTLLVCCREKLHEAHSDLQKKREVIDDLEPKVDSNSKSISAASLSAHLSIFSSHSTLILFFYPSVAKKIDELQEILRKKDEDMKQMEERYKRYVEKARTVSPTELNVLSSSYSSKIKV